MVPTELLDLELLDRLALVDDASEAEIARRATLRDMIRRPYPLVRRAGNGLYRLTPLGWRVAEALEKTT